MLVIGVRDPVVSTPPPSTFNVSGQTGTVAVAVAEIVVTDVDVVVEVVKSVTGISVVSVIVVNTTIVVAGVVTVGTIYSTTVDSIVGTIVTAVAFSVVVRVASAEEQADEIKLGMTPLRGSGRPRGSISESRSCFGLSREARLARSLGRSTGGE
jgi:hypothetical protein